MPAHALAPPKQNWNVQQGEAQNLAHGLENSEAQALIFVSHADPDDERTKALFGFLRRASEVAHVVIEQKQQSSWNAIIEALTPAIPLTSNRVVEAKMLAQAMTMMIESQDFVRAVDIAEIGHFSSKNPSSQPNRWKNSGLIFAIPYKGVDLYPLYALEVQNGAKPLPVMEKILAVLQDKDDWQKAFWFTSPNSYLKDKAPKDLLKSKPENVLRAAETEAAGVQHG